MKIVKGNNDLSIDSGFSINFVSSVFGYVHFSNNNKNKKKEKDIKIEKTLDINKNSCLCTPVRGRSVVFWGEQDDGLDIVDSLDRDPSSFPWEEQAGKLGLADKFAIYKSVLGNALGDSKDVLIFVESIMLLGINIYQCTTVKHMVTVLVAFVHAAVRMPVLAGDIVDEITGTFASMEDGYMSSDSDFELQAGFDFKSLFTHWTAVCNSELAIKLKRIVGMFVSLGVCQSCSIPFTLDFYNKLFGEGMFSSVIGSDIMGYAVDFCIMLYDRGLEAWNTGNIWSLFGDSAIVKADADYIKLVGARQHYMSSSIRLSSDFADEHDYCLRLSVCQEVYGRALKASKALPIRSFYTSKLSMLAQIEADIQHYDQANAIRKAPFALLLFGNPGTGKTTVLNELSNLLLRVNGLESNANTKVSLNSNDKYQSEYRSHHKVVVLDDISNTSAAKVQESPLRLIIDMVNNDPKMALNADVAMKGRIAFKPLIVLGTTNIKCLQSGVFSVAPHAVLRRFNYIITFKVRPEFAKDGMIDPAKMVNDVNDAWLFTVEKSVMNAEDPSKLTFRTHVEPGIGPCVDISLHQLFKLVGAASVEHLKQQQRLVDVASSAFDRPLCPHSSIASICPQCMEPQSGIDTVVHRVRALHNGFAAFCGAHLAPRPNKVGWLTRKISDAVAAKIINERKFIMGFFSFQFVSSICAYLIGMVGLKLLLLSGLTSPIVASVAYGTLHNIVSDSLSNETTNRIKKAADKIWLSGIVQVSVVLGAVVMFRKVYMLLFGLRLQGAIVSAPVRDAVQKQDVWLKPHIEKPDPVTDLRGATLEQLTGVIERHMKRARFIHGTIEGRFSCCNILPCKSNCYFVPYHVLKSGYTSVELISSVNTSLSPNRVIKFLPTQWRRIGDSDMCLLTLPSAGAVRDLTALFPTNYTRVRGRGVHLSYDVDMNFSATNTTYSPELFDCPGIGTYEAVRFVMHGAVTSLGMCVSPILSTFGGLYIVGLHTMGVTGSPDGMAACLLRQDIDATFDALYGSDNDLNFEVLSVGGWSFQNSYEDIQLLGGLHKNSPFNFMETGGPIKLYGAHTGKRRHFKSEVVDSYIAPFVKDVFGMDQMYGPPKNISNWKPWHADAVGLLSIRDVDAGLLTLAYRDILRSQDEFIDKYSLGYLQSKVHPIPLENVLAGADGVSAVDRMDLNTSTGWPYNRPKKEFISLYDGEVAGISSPLQLSEELRKEVDDLERKYLSGYRGHCIFRVSLKDEPTKLGKEKVRTIAGSPLALTILCRKYYLMIIKLIREHPYEFESAVGVNAYGDEWHGLVTHIQRFGEDRVVAGDFAMYDTLMSSMITYTGFKLLIRLARFAGYSEDQLRIMRGIATDICEPVYEYNGEFISVVGSNASGHGLTVIINNFGNMLYQRMSYYDQYEGKPPGDYNKFVSALNFGDDNLFGVSPAASEFGHTSMQRSLEKWGLKYTMADKVSESKQYISLSEATFLKRGFRFSADLSRYVAPIEKSSIFKNLLSSRGSKAVCPEQLAADSISMAASEYFLHGEEEYSEFVRCINKVIELSNLSGFMKGPLPTFAQMKSEYLAKYPS